LEHLTNFILFLFFYRIPTWSVTEAQLLPAGSLYLKNLKKKYIIIFNELVFDSVSAYLNPS
jgi:hypothetical protein